MPVEVIRCKTCGDRMSSLPILARHMATVHKSSSKNKPSQRYLCPHCKNEFARRDNLMVHLKGRCKVLKSAVGDNNTINSSFTADNASSITSNSHNRTSNSHNRTSNKTTINMYMVPFGQEDISCLSDDDIRAIGTSRDNPILKMTKLLNMNSMRKQYHNILYNNFRSSIALVYGKRGWTERKISTIQDDILRLNLERLRILEETSKVLTDDMRKRFRDANASLDITQHFDPKDEASRYRAARMPVARGKLFSHMRFALYRGRKIVKETKDQLESEYGSDPGDDHESDPEGDLDYESDSEDDPDLDYESESEPEPEDDPDLDYESDSEEDLDSE